MTIRFNLSAESVRNTCILYNLYTRGDNDAYGKMLSSCKPHMTTAQLRKIAEDIKIHSDCEENVTEIMSILTYKAWVSFIE